MLARNYVQLALVILVILTAPLASATSVEPDHDAEKDPESNCPNNAFSPQGANWWDSPTTADPQESQRRPRIIRVETLRRKDRINTYPIETKTYFTSASAGEDVDNYVSADAVLVREGNRHRAPLLYVFIGGGPGLTGLTMSENLSFLDGDLLFLLPPGNTYRPRQRDIISNVRNGYDLKIEAYIRLIEKTSRETDQRVVLVAHSYGGFESIDLMTQTVKSERLNIAGAIFIASPISKTTYKAVEDLRRQASLPKWDTFYEGYQKQLRTPGRTARLLRSYHQLVLAYGGLLHNDHPTQREVVERIILNDPSSPESMVFAKRRFTKNDDDELIKILHEFTHIYGIKMLGFIGELDRMMPFERAVEDYTRAGIEFHKVPNGSHFPFVEKFPFIEEIVRRTFPQPSR